MSRICPTCNLPPISNCAFANCKREFATTPAPEGNATEQARPVGKFNPRFGDMLRNKMASERNPHRDAYFIRAVVKRGRLDPGRWFELTDGKGEVWQAPAANMVPLAAPMPAPLPVTDDARDAARWRRLVNASEREFPVATIADDPENDCTLIYGRQRLEQLIDSYDEISDRAIDAARASTEGKP